MKGERVLSNLLLLCNPDTQGSVWATPPLKQKADADGVVLIGLFGHGVEVETVDADGVAIKDGCFCPFDTAIREALDFQGKPRYDANKKPQIEPDPGTLIKLGDLMRTLKLAKAGNRIVLADCCRTTPNAARGRSSFGAGFNVQDLPENTSLLFGCSPNEQAFEHKDWGHGAFTKCLLDTIGELSADGSAVDTAQLASQMKKRVPALVASVSPRDKQTPKPFITDVVDLQLVLKQEVEKLLTNTLGMKLTLIPSGEFRMGSTDADIEAVLKLDASLKKETFADEQPQHRVRITKPFYMGVHEVTKGQFAAFVKDKSYKTDAERDGKGGYGFDGEKFEQKPEYTWKNVGFPQTDDHPVVNVSWNDAVAFCEWLSAKEGQTYQLPSEAQWEYACRAGTTSLWWHGADAEGLARIGNVADGTAKEKFSNFKGTITAKDGYVFTAPVGRFRANAFGLHDMHGNAFEWCQDGYDEGVYATRTGVTSDPVNVSTVARRVLRGGSWFNDTWYTRSANRYRYSPDDRGSSSGFRVSRTQ